MSKFTKMESGNTRSLSYCFTLNNYTSDDITSLLLSFKNSFLYVFQEELGENETRHLQGVVKWKIQRSFKTMKKIHSKIHWERCRNVKNSILYCTKEDTRNGKIWKFNISKYEPHSHEDFLNNLLIFKNKCFQNIKTRDWFINLYDDEHI